MVSGRSMQRGKKCPLTKWENAFTRAFLPVAHNPKVCESAVSYHIAKKSQPDMVEGHVMKETTHCKQELIVPGFDLKMDSKLDMS